MSPCELSHRRAFFDDSCAFFAKFHPLPRLCLHHHVTCCRVVVHAGFEEATLGDEDTHYFFHDLP